MLKDTTQPPSRSPTHVSSRPLMLYQKATAIPYRPVWTNRQKKCFVQQSQHHGGDSNDATCVVVRVLCIPSKCKTQLPFGYMVDGRKYDTSDFAVVRDMIQLSVYSDDSKFLHVMVYKVLGRQHPHEHSA